MWRVKKIVPTCRRVIEVAWNPHREGQLVSVSYDFSAQVWDIATLAPTHSFQVCFRNEFIAKIW
jgi:hypothetical protein